MSNQSHLAIENLCQIEIQVKSLRNAGRFYQNAFGWQVLPADIHGYGVLKVPRNCPYGVSLVENKNRDKLLSAFVLYFQANNRDEIVANVKTFGGTVHIADQPLPGYGAFSLISDLDGNKFGIISQPRTKNQTLS